MASVNTELKIDDDYVRAQAKQIAQWAEDLQKGIDKYISILNSISKDAIMEGETAKALKSYNGYVANLKGIVADMGHDARIICTSYILEVDKEDSFLY